jgi:hypothetical protein
MDINWSKFSVSTDLLSKEESENETTGRFNNHLYRSAHKLRCATTTAGASSNAAAACTGTSSGTHSPARASPTPI